MKKEGPRGWRLDLVTGCLIKRYEGSDEASTSDRASVIKADTDSKTYLRGPAKPKAKRRRASSWRRERAASPAMRH